MDWLIERLNTVLLLLFFCINFFVNFGVKAIKVPAQGYIYRAKHYGSDWEWLMNNIVKKKIRGKEKGENCLMNGVKRP